MLIVAYRLSEGHTSDLNMLMTPGSIEVATRLNDEALFTQLDGHIQSDDLTLTRVLWSDTHMACILEGHIIDALALKRIEELHREGSLGIELERAQTALHIVEDVSIGHLHRALEDTTGDELHTLIVHIESRTTRIAQDICIHHSTLRSVLDEDLDRRLVDVGLLGITIERHSKHHPDAQEVEPPEAKEVEENIKQIDLRCLFTGLIRPIRLCRHRAYGLTLEEGNKGGSRKSRRESCRHIPEGGEDLLLGIALTIAILGIDNIILLEIEGWRLKDILREHIQAVVDILIAHAADDIDLAEVGLLREPPDSSNELEDVCLSIV